MDNTRTKKDISSVVRNHLGRFLSDNRSHKASRKSVFRRIYEQKWNAFVFGGAIRDVVIHGPYVQTRDVDIVVENVEIEELETAFKNLILRKTRFGGLHIYSEGWHFDIWPLHETWAFKDKTRDESTAQELPKTTFLTIEAVVVQLKTRIGKPRLVFEHGFFDSISNRVIELNQADNPYPALAIVRALATARKLRFRIGPKLSNFIATQCQQFTMADFREAQRSHYGNYILTDYELDEYLNTILNNNQSLGNNPLDLGFSRQLLFHWMEPRDTF